MKLVITRPRLDAEPLAQKILALGHQVVVAPVLEIVARENVEIPKRAFQAVCVTSANSLRCLTAPIDFAIPVLAVGEQSAAAARAFGFANITAQGGDVHGLVKYILSHIDPKAGPLLYISGAETSGDLEGQLRQSGYDVTRVISYDAIPQNLLPFRAEIESSSGVLLYSPRSAKLWQKQIELLNLTEKMADMAHFCLSLQVASIISQNSHIVIAKAPSEDAMLTLLQRRIGDRA